MKDIDGRPAYPANARPWYKRLLRRIYISFVGDAYIPRPTRITLVRQRQTIHPRYGQITHIILYGDRYKVEGEYIFEQFGTIIDEHTL